MVVIKRDMREKARELRKQGWSVRDITLELGVSKGSVSMWVRDIELTEEQQTLLKSRQAQWAGRNQGGKTNRAKAMQQRIVYQQAGRERARNGNRLHHTGCLLYWCEGAKVKRNSVHFVNSDPNMMLLFMRFLREEMKADEPKFRLQIHCHTQDEIEQHRIEKYWLTLLNLPETCLQKTQFKQGSNTRKKRLENGVCALMVHSTELAMHIYGAIQEYGGFDNPDWLF